MLSYWPNHLIFLFFCLQFCALGVDADDHGVEQHLDAQSVSIRSASAESFGRRAQDPAAASSRMTRAAWCRSARKSRLSVWWHSSAIWPAISTPVGPAPTTTKVSSAATLAVVVGALGQLEGAEDAAAQLQRVVDGLHAGRELGELVVAEVGLAGAGGDDQRVVRGHGGPAEQPAR